jgi:hypothetical protein
LKKVIFECTGNIILIILVGLAFINPGSTIQNNENGLEFTSSIYVAILFVYIIVFGIVRYVVLKKSKKGFFKYSETTYNDEREKIIVSNATKLSYLVTIGFLITSMAILAFMKAISNTSIFQVDINIYTLSISLLTIAISLAFITFCIKWCIEYKK